MFGYKKAIGNKWYCTVTKKICIPPEEMIKLGKWLCHGSMRTLLLSEEFPYGSKTGLALQRPKLSSKSKLKFRSRFKDTFSTKLFCETRNTPARTEPGRQASRLDVMG